jgi:hypothetical protein
MLFRDIERQRMVNDEAEQALPPYGEPAARQLLTHLSRRGFPYGSPPVKRDVRRREAFDHRINGSQKEFMITARRLALISLIR